MSCLKICIRTSCLNICIGDELSRGPVVRGRFDVVSKKNIGRCYCAEWLPLLPLTSVTQVHIPVGDKI